MQSMNETAELIDIRCERKARVSTPPGAKLVSWEVIENGRLRVLYRYPGTVKPNTIEVAL